MFMGSCLETIVDQQWTTGIVSHLLAFLSFISLHYNPLYKSIDYPLVCIRIHLTLWSRIMSYFVRKWWNVVGLVWFGGVWFVQICNIKLCFYVFFIFRIFLTYSDWLRFFKTMFSDAQGIFPVPPDRCLHFRFGWCSKPASRSRQMQTCSSSPSHLGQRLLLQRLADRVCLLWYVLICCDVCI